MKFGWILFEIAINIFEGVIMTLFLANKLTFKDSISKPMRITLLSLEAICIAVFFSLYIWFDLSLSDTAYLCITLLFSIFLYNDKWYIKLVWNSCLGIIMVCIASLFSSLFLYITKTTWDVLTEPSLLRMTFVINSNIIIFFTLFIITKLKPKQTHLSKLSLSLYILLNCVLIFSIELLFALATANLTNDNSTIFIAIFSIFAAALIALAIFEILSFNTEKQASLEASLEFERLSKAHNEEMHTMYENILIYRHDIKHHISAIEHMLENGDLENSRSYINKVKSMSLPIRYSTGNTFVDSVLSAKALHMQQSSIEFELVSHPLHTLPITEIDFCSMLGNILDNAIEAACRLPDSQPKKIILHFTKARNMLYLTCTNSIDPASIHKVGNSFLSSKRKGKLGIGIPSIKHIVDNVDGFYSFNCEGNTMVVEIALPYAVKGEIL